MPGPAHTDRLKSVWTALEHMKAEIPATPEVMQNRSPVIDVGIALKWEQGHGWACLFRLRRQGEARVDAAYETYDRLSRHELLDVLEAVLSSSLQLG